jgi:glycosyltransferase involved in cell wall biosynthesis
MKLESTPLVTVLMPCFNVERYVLTAIKSIQNQSYRNLEIILIEDGSTDETKSIIEKIREEDIRIKILYNEHNLGLSKSLNKAIQHANGKYIARMDADDISTPTRIEKQLHYLNLNPHISVLGTAAISMNEAGKLSIVKPIVYCESNTLSFSAYFTQPLFHGSILAKSVVMKRFKYDESSRAEDFELWLRMVHQGIKIANLKDELYFYRVNTEGYSRQNQEPQAKSHNNASMKYLESKLNTKLGSGDVALINNRPQESISFITLKAGMVLFNSFFTNYENKDSEEIKRYYKRQKIDIYIQVVKKSNSLPIKIFGLLKLFYLILTPNGFSYLKSKFQVRFQHKEE